MNSINANKKMKWSRNRKRLRDALESNIYTNELSKMLISKEKLKDILLINKLNSNLMSDMRNMKEDLYEYHKRL